MVAKKKDEGEAEDLSRPLAETLQHGLKIVNQLQFPGGGDAGVEGAAATPLKTKEEEKEKKDGDGGRGGAVEGGVLSSPSASSREQESCYTDKSTGICFLKETDLQYEHVDERQALRTPGILHKCQYVACNETEEEEEEEEEGGEGERRGRRFSHCAKCGVRYCSRDHQVLDWKTCQHKKMCPYIKSVREGVPLDPRDIVIRLLCQIRLHLGPFTLAHSDKQGRGFAFVQSPCTLEDLASPLPVSCAGRKLDRSVLVHYMTMGEYVDVVLQDDFELAELRPSLEAALTTTTTDDQDTHIILLLRLRCGYVAVIRQPLVPNARACRKLAEDYGWAQHSSLQLNLDD